MDMTRTVLLNTGEYTQNEYGLKQLKLLLLFKGTLDEVESYMRTNKKTLKGRRIEYGY